MAQWASCKGPRGERLALLIGPSRLGSAFSDIVRGDVVIEVVRLDGPRLPPTEGRARETARLISEGVDPALAEALPHMPNYTVRHRLKSWQPLSALSELAPGDIVRHSESLTGGPSYVVMENYGTRVTAMRAVDITNPSEWEVFK